MDENLYKDILLSVCIPTYNRAALLKRTLLSIPNHKSIEIVVSDNSTNGDSELLVKEHFANAGCRWQYHKNNFPVTWSGSKLMVENFNMGIKLAKGQYIMFIHDDDFMWANGLDGVLEYIQKGNSKVYLFGINLVDFEGNKLKSQTVPSDIYLGPEEALFLLLSNSSFVRFPSIVAHREVFRQVGMFNPLCKGPTDIDMWARMFASFGVYRVARILSAYTIHNEAQTMGTFNESNIRILLDIFENVSTWKILTERQLLHAKSKFFHQFILAGVFRRLKKGEIQEAKKIMNLFKIPEMKELNVPAHWLPVRAVFSIILFIPTMSLKLSYH